MAIKGATSVLPHVKVTRSEVGCRAMYRGHALSSHIHYALKSRFRLAG